MLVVNMFGSDKRLVLSGGPDTQIFLGGAPVEPSVTDDSRRDSTLCYDASSYSFGSVSLLQQHCAAALWYLFSYVSVRKCHEQQQQRVVCTEL